MYSEGQWMFLTLWEVLLFLLSSGCRKLPHHNDLPGQETWHNATEPAGGIRCCTNFQEVQGKCIECPPGRYGISCSLICPEGYYGGLCLNICNCSVGFICRPKDGCVFVANVSSSDITKTEKEPTHEKTVFDSFKIAGFLGFGSLATSGLIAVFVFLRKCCDRREQLPESISALLRTLQPLERRSQIYQRKTYDAEHSIGAVGEAAEEKEKKVYFETRKSIDEYFTIATSSHQRAPSKKNELSSSRKYPHLSKKNEAPRSEESCNILTVENDDIDTEDYSILSQPLMIPPHQTETTIVDEEAFQTSKIPFSFHKFTPELSTWCGNLDFGNNDNAAMDTENDMDDSNGKRHPFNDTRKEVSPKQRSANNEGKADAIKNELVDTCLALDPTNLDSHVHNMSLATFSVNSEIGSEGKELNEKLNYNCPSKRLKQSVYAIVTKHQQVSANKQDFAKNGNMNICPTNSIRIGTQYRIVDKETLFETNREAEKQCKSGSFSFVALEDIHHSQTNTDTNAAELNNPLYQPSDTCRKAEEKNDAEQYIQNLQDKQVAGEHTSFSNERPYSVVVKRSTIRMAIQHNESDPKINEKLHSEKGKFEQTNTSDACGETPTRVANVLPDLVLGRQMNTDQNRREYSMAFNCTNNNDLRKVKAKSTIPSKEDINDLKNCSTSSEKVIDTKISEVCHNETSFKDDLERVYEDYENVKKPKSQPTRRLTKLKASVISTINRMKSTKIASRVKEVEMSESLKMQEGKRKIAMETLVGQQDQKDTSSRSDSLMQARGNSTDERNTTFRSSANSPIPVVHQGVSDKQHVDTFQERHYGVAKPSSPCSNYHN